MSPNTRNLEKLQDKQRRLSGRRQREAIQKWTQEASGISDDDPIFKIEKVSYKDPRTSENHDPIM